ncbi:MAG: anti-sigma F factor [Clostridia bacterium]|nr:anti-sigma F factor [Clostridia bacterium]
MKNYMRMELSAIGSNEGFARSTVAAFALPLNPSLAELSDLKTAVSEAVTNCIVHAYASSPAESSLVVIECETEPFLEGEDAGNEGGGIIHIRVRDYGCGIDDVGKALQPFYTTKEDEERSGMGFTIMQTFMDGFKVESEKGVGTTVFMSKKIGLKDGVDA